MMDSTHKTNGLGWFLYTVMVRERHGCWVPAAHFLTEKEDGDVIIECLKQIREWTPWRPRYFLTDDSATEQRAVRETFGEDLDVQHLLCHKHVDATLREKFKGPTYEKSLQHMLAALKYRRTRPGCMDSLQRAIDALPGNKSGTGLAGAALKLAKYIRKEYMETIDSWANCTRDHSPLLLQHKTTNALESFHSLLKRDGIKALMPAFSLKGCVSHVLTVARGYDRKIQAAAYAWYSKLHPRATQ